MLMRSLASLLFLLALASTCSAQEHDWHELYSLTGRFTVLMPSVPEEKIVQAPSEAGNIATHTFQVETEDGILAIAYSDLPPVDMSEAKRDSVLVNGRNGVVRNVAGEVLEETVSTCQGYPCRDLHVSAYGGVMSFRCRLILADRRLYVLMAGARNDSTLPDYQRFLSSFHIEDDRGARGVLRSHLKSLGYRIEELDNGDCRVVVAFDDGRSQTLYFSVDSSAFHGGEVFEVWSPVVKVEGDVPDSVVQSLFGLDRRHDLGSYYLSREEGATLVTIWARLDAQIDTLRLGRGIIAVASAADEAERTLSGPDTY